ncbi:MAG: alpha-L-fucosidase, partial [Planctomycetota bacterium]
KPAEFWRSAELNAMVRRHQPGILINDRSGLPEDFGTPEQVVRPAEQGRLWETCMTLNPAPGWGFLHGPLVVKSPAEVLWHLLDAVRRGGNFLFNVGPDATGALAPRDIATLAELGRWLEHHGEAVYDTHPDDIYRTGVPQGTAFHYGMFTQRGNVAYLTIFYPPPDGTLVLTRLAGGLRSATLIDDGAACEIVPLDNDRHRISGLPTEPSAMPRVVKLTFDQPPQLVGTSDASWLLGTHRHG